MSNFDIPIVQRPPTRIVASDTFTLAAGANREFIGRNAKQDRVQFVVTNLDALLALKIQNLSGRNAATVFPQNNVTLETSADLRVYNPNAAPCDCEVTELYPDTGNYSGAGGAAGRPGAGAGAGAAGGGAAGGGGSGRGGGTQIN